MARARSHVRAGNDKNKEVSASGRGAGSYVWAILNTDNIRDQDVKIRVTAMGGTKSIFHVILPEMSDAVSVYVNGMKWNGESLEKIDEAG